MFQFQPFREVEFRESFVCLAKNIYDETGYRHDPLNLIETEKNTLTNKLSLNI